MKINLMMRMGLLMMFVFLSCKKDAGIKDSEPIVKDSPVKVVDGVLRFSNDQAFVQTMLAVNAMSPEERTDWEKKMGFTSLRSIYHQFNQELDKMEAVQDKDGFFAVKNKYNKVAVWNNAGTSYEINCRGILEAGIVNADGLVQINDQVLQYSRDQVTTSTVSGGSADARKSSGGNVIWTREKKDLLARDQSALIAYGGHGVVNQLRMGEGGILSGGPMEDGPEAKAYAQVKIYNFLLNGQNRGFCTVYFRAEHRNWLGIMRQVTCFGGGIRGEHYVTLNNQGNQILFASGTWGGEWGTKGPNWRQTFESNHEVVLIVSAELKNNPVTIGYIPPYLNNQFANADFKIIEDGSSNNFWTRYVPFGQLETPLAMRIYSIGTPPNAKYHSFTLEFK
ncbi:DUF4848 domain-containing protein [Chitinophaga varians]|uniref:DUF4848 domain-containing protein n=1 Tax=Chitinophaga varians TaxID=2202339 RepID=A0A847RTI8_9BACT|nr:DUF4848 domain-containing protein [Chitinophaga varians]NLR64188.1 DUF4848 domain-containing protein [Chitinophaga varians]